MRRLALLGLVVALAARLASAEQDVRPIIPPGTGEQEVEALTPRGDQDVRAARMAGEQQVEPLKEPSRSAKAASTAGKVATAVAATAVSLGAAAAMLLFL
jgi:hypothetical protein